MKFEKLVIECSSFKERDLVFSVLDSIGYSDFGGCRDEQYLFIHTYVDGDYVVSHSAENHEGAEQLTSSQFLSKHSNQFHDKIKQAMSDFGLGREELSRKLGYSDPYITKMLTLPQSEKVKKGVVEKIDNLYQSKKSIGTLVVDLEQSPEFKKVIAETKAEIKKVAEENEQLKKELEHKNQVLDKRNDLFKDAEYEIKVLSKKIESTHLDLIKRENEVDSLNTTLNYQSNEIAWLSVELQISNETLESLQVALNAKPDSKRIAELEILNKQLVIDLSKRNKDVSLLNFGCIGLIVIVVAMACFVVGG